MSSQSNPTLKPTKKQHLAWEQLKNKGTREILFGGGAGGGKSWLGCEWLFTSCIMYPGTTYFIGRNRLKDIRVSTNKTLRKMLKHHGLNSENFFKYNGLDHIYEFHNGSTIECLELKYYPTEDPIYERFGSREYTSGWIEEAGEVHFAAYDVLKSRIGRTYNDKYGLTAKLLMTCNPKKNWLYTEFFMPNKNSELPDGRAFVQSLIDDNPLNEKGYKENLQNIKSKNTRERLLFGNWEYDDDPTRMFEYDAILDMFTNQAERGQKYLTIDVARHGSDRTVFKVWDGWQIIHIEEHKITSVNFTVDRAKELCEKHKIGRSHVGVDEDGVGGGVVDYLPGCFGFIAQAKPIDTGERCNYANLKTQCAFLLAQKVQNREIGIDECEPEIRDFIVADFEQVKEKDPDKDNKLRICSKDTMKEHLGRSPDFFDAANIRMAFDLEPVPTLDFI